MILNDLCIILTRQSVSINLVLQRAKRICLHNLGKRHRFNNGARMTALFCTIISSVSTSPFTSGFFIRTFEGS